MPEFTKDYTTANIKNWEKWFGHLKDESCDILELGCYEGRTTLWFLQNFVNSTVEVVDTFRGEPEHGVELDSVLMYDRFRDNVKHYNLIINVEKTVSRLVTRLYTFLEDNIDGYYDIIYIDASHKAINVIEDSVLSFKVLKSGGFMVWDDYAWKPPVDELKEDPTQSPKLSIDSFLAIYKGKYKLLGKNRQVCIQKI